MMAPPSDRFDQLRAAVITLFDGSVAVVVTDPSRGQPALKAVERPAVAGAIPARQTEFAAGRAAARAAMAQIGIVPGPVPAGPDRAPVWPKGVIGSITHTDKLCIAVVTPVTNIRSLGVDAEPATPLDFDLIPTICSAAEQAQVAGPDLGRLAKVIFSAKEATYKAQYPLTGMLFGYDHLDISLDPSAGSFVATFLKPAPPFAVGDTLPGRFVQVADHIVTAVTIGQGMPEGA